MSGSLQEVRLEDCCRKSNYIFVVTIIKNFEAVVEELERFDKEVCTKNVYKAVIREVIHRDSFDMNHTREGWQIRFPVAEEKGRKQLSADKISGLSVGDEIYIMNYEDINYSIIYHVEGKHKIFYYYSGVEQTKSIEIGKTYIFIATNHYSENKVLYGNIKYGLYPNSRIIRLKIKSILNN